MNTTRKEQEEKKDFTNSFWFLIATIAIGGIIAHYVSR